MINGEWLIINEEVHAETQSRGGLGVDKGDWAEGFEFGKSRSLSDFRLWLNKENFRKMKFFTHYLAAKIVSKCLFINGHGRDECQFEQGRELLVGNGGLSYVGAEYIQHGCGNGFIIYDKFRR